MRRPRGPPSGGLPGSPSGRDGGVLAARQGPSARPGPCARSARGEYAVTMIADRTLRGDVPMWSLKSVRRSSPRPPHATARRWALEALEDRALLSVSPAAIYPLSTITQAEVA